MEDGEKQSNTNNTYKVRGLQKEKGKEKEMLHEDVTKESDRRRHK